MLFNRNIEPSCSYCSRSTKISDTEIICIKKGVMPAYSSCRRFEYDPLKRVPEAYSNINYNKLDSDDFDVWQPEDTE